ncbi:interferon-induced protein 44-like [Chanos chanos]|uniref:Interferon-induced protein 44-like n=1 Tax=Chanos chanos TaxID=29144 RepID=A0A6J2WAL9_CHACN|nr:interferon-induced protein 44-like [Chanos chanos]
MVAFHLNFNYPEMKVISKPQDQEVYLGSEITLSFEVDKYKTYTFQHCKNCEPFVIGDIMGLEEGGAVTTEDIINILKGHVKDNYKFQPDAPLGTRHCDYNPSLRDQIHCLVNVVSANQISLMQDDVIQKMRHIREAASDMGIPQVVIMTMVDEACPIVHNNLNKIYRSAKIKEKMEVCHTRLGVPMSFIFPVKNYHAETSLNPEVDYILLHALKHIIRLANDYADNQ